MGEGESAEHRDGDFHYWNFVEVKALELYNIGDITARYMHVLPLVTHIKFLFGEMWGVESEFITSVNNDCRQDVKRINIPRFREHMKTVFAGRTKPLRGSSRRVLECGSLRPSRMLVYQMNPSRCERGSLNCP